MDKTITIALAGNPNSGKTTLFNALTGANQYVGNWPGVTVEKKEGRLRGHRNVVLADLPGIYSLSPYTLEEVIARNYLLEERPDAIINIVDGTNLERNLYLTTQLLELGIPVVVALNLIDVVRRSPNKIDTAALAEELGCPVVEVSALKGIGIDKVTALAVEAATSDVAGADCVAADADKSGGVGVVAAGGAGVPAKGGPGAAAGCKCRQKNIPRHTFSGVVEHALAHIEEEVLHDLPLERQRWFAIKLFERDEMAQELLETELKAAGLPPLTEKQRAHIETDICRAEAELDDDAESIITGERYEYISRILLRCYDKRDHGRLSTSDKIDRVVTNRWAALPIFAAVMFLVYYLAIVTIGTWATDWANDGLFGDGFHVFGRGAAEFAAAEEAYERPGAIKDAFLEAAVEAGAVEQSASSDEDGEIVLIPEKARAVTALAVLHDEDGGVLEEITVDYDAYLAVADVEEPDPADFGTWARGIPVIVEGWLESANAAPWLSDLIVHGIIAGVGAVLGFVPQMIVLFLLLALLEGCGYMARVAFVLDRIFRRFGLSGKSFIPMLIGTGCSIPGIMASRTIESERDRRMTIMTTSFMPCSAKLPIIALIAGALFGGAWWVAPSAYFVGIAAIIVSGVILKKTRPFAGDAAPFVMELPPYRWPTAGVVLRSTWERAWSFIKKAGTVILLATIFVWFTSSFGWVDGKFGMVESSASMLAAAGNAVSFLFAPLGWGNWQSAVATFTGLIAKENVVGTMGVLFGGVEDVAENGWQIWERVREVFTPLSAYSFLLFNLLCAPCFAAIGAIRREMNNWRWTTFAIVYQTVLAYAVSLIVYQLGMLFTGAGNVLGSVVAFVLLAVFLWLLFRPASKPSPARVEAG